MNNEELKTNSNSDRVYRATTNLNTAIENPDVTINTATDVNIQSVNNYNQTVSDDGSLDNNINDIALGLENNNLSAQYVDSPTNQFIPGNVQVDVKRDVLGVSEEVNTLNDSEKVSYEPTIKAKKKPSKKVSVSKEVKAMSVIIFILLMFVLVIPYIYDFLEGPGLIITS